MDKMGMKKRGISAIVATVLIILITVAGVAIIWVAIIPMIDLDGINTDVSLSIISSEGYTVWDNSSRLATVHVGRGSDESDLIGLELVFSLSGDSVSHYYDVVPEANAMRVYYINLSNYSGDLSSISVVPVFKGGKVGRVSGEISIGKIGKADVLKLIKSGVLRASDFVGPNLGYNEGGFSSSVCEVENAEDSFSCFDGDVYWYDDCDGRAGLKEECDFGCNGVVCEDKPEYTTSIEQYGITWTFDKAYQFGTFANGDYWVKTDDVTGVVTVTNIFPIGDGGRNGSMVNPSVPNKQGFDSRADNPPYLSYDASLSVSPPVQLVVNDSLISTESLVVMQGYSYIKSAAVLTCLNSAPPVGSFRPPYFGNDKPIYSSKNLQTDLIPNLPSVGGEPTWDVIRASDYGAGPNLDWGLKYVREYTVPVDQYGSGYAGGWTMLINNIILKIAMNDSLDEKLPSIYRIVQLGIDTYSFVDHGTYYNGDGGHGFGRKLPILFAGLLLDNSDMLSIGSAPKTLDGWRFGEDDQTFYVTSAGVSDNAEDGLSTLERTRTHEKTEFVKAFLYIGTADGGNANSVILASDASSANNYYNNLEIEITSGSGIGDIRKIDSYVGTTKVATVDLPWSASPSSSSVYEIRNNPANSIILETSTGISDLGDVKGLYLSLDTDPVQTRLCDYYNLNSRLATFTEDFDISLTADVNQFTIMGYNSSDIGTPEWGMYHYSAPNQDTKSLDAGYRGVGQQLQCISMGARIFDLVDEWNHLAFFDYEDRFVPIWESLGKLDDHPWCINLWNEYRANYGNVWGCVGAEQLDCPKQLGVCQDSFETCTNNEWPGCDYGSMGIGYSVTETCSGGEDNDCDGFVDGFDSDCGGTETSCIDGVDNDGDFLIDCDDDDDCSADSACNPPEDYVSYWKFDSETLGITSDESGINDGVLSGAEIVSDSGSDIRQGNVLSLNGDDDYVDMGIDDSLWMDTENFTISLWIKGGTTQSFYAGIISKGETSSNAAMGYVCYYSAASDTNIACSIGNGSTFVSTGSVALSINSWHHFSFRYNTTDIAIFLDGVHQKSAPNTLTGSLTGSGDRVLLGDWKTTNNNPFNGFIDEVMIFNRSLSIGEIDVIYCSQGGDCT